MSRNQGIRMMKTASREQWRRKRNNLGMEGLSCPICSPKPWTAANKRQQSERAALEEIYEEM
jgi:hypothetical protein